eukprot:scaffold89038_cov51-Cyclotella_meneghiniana.AAC.3
MQGDGNSSSFRIPRKKKYHAGAANSSSINPKLSPTDNNHRTCDDQNEPTSMFIEKKNCNIPATSSGQAESVKYVKIKVGRIAGYPVLVKQGKVDHDALLLGCDNNPHIYLADACKKNTKVKVKWITAGYNSNVSADSVQLKQFNDATPARASKEVAISRISKKATDEDNRSDEDDAPILKVLTARRLDNLTDKHEHENDEMYVDEDDRDEKLVCYTKSASTGHPVNNGYLGADNAQFDDANTNIDNGTFANFDNSNTDTNIISHQKVKQNQDESCTITTFNDVNNEPRPQHYVRSNMTLKSDENETDEEALKPEIVASSNPVKLENDVPTDDEACTNATFNEVNNEPFPQHMSSNMTLKSDETDTDDEALKPEMVASSHTIKLENDVSTDDEAITTFNEVNNEPRRKHVKSNMNPSVVFDDGYLRIPSKDCTQRAFFEYLPHLRVRDLICWALRTETKVRLAKIERRSASTSKTLNSEYLIDVYPDCGTDVSKDVLTHIGHDEYKFSRKAHPGLVFLSSASQNWDGLTPIIIEPTGESEPKIVRKTEGSSFDGKEIVPPTLLHFDIILEAFMGYILGAGISTSYYNSPDTSLPRAAVMGGAVVAALTAYQDKFVVEAFANSKLFVDGRLTDENEYWEAKINLIKMLHNHFIFQQRGPSSSYSKGDVDIFMQASPLTRSVINKLFEHGIRTSQIDIISSYIGNTSFCQGDIERFVTGVMGTTRQKNGIIEPPDGTKFAFALSRSAVSFILGKRDYYERSFSSEFDHIFWPTQLINTSLPQRTSQFIMLDSHADLLGGLLDFDQSIVVGAYDGTSVRVAPRAALSLMTSSNFVTPFCFEEHRNKKRVVKYAHRGFKPFLVDPHDTKPLQNIDCDTSVPKSPFVPLGHINWRDNIEDDTKMEIAGIQDEKVERGEQRILCCHMLGAYDSIKQEQHYQPLGDDSRTPGRGIGVAYTQMMFETSQGDAIAFFRKRFKWSDDDLVAVNSIDPYLRMACRRCKVQYNLIRVVMTKHPDLMKEYWLDEESLRGSFSYMHTLGECKGEYEPSFYSGGVFESTRVRDNARPTLKILSSLHAQKIFEVASYIMKHGSPDNYKKRFVHGDNLEEVFQMARLSVLQKSKRPPVGLNPERFIERCVQCQRWLIGYQYGVKECEMCSESSFRN